MGTEENVGKNRRVLVLLIVIVVVLVLLLLAALLVRSGMFGGDGQQAEVTSTVAGAEASDAGSENESGESSSQQTQANTPTATKVVQAGQETPMVTPTAASESTSTPDRVDSLSSSTPSSTTTGPTATPTAEMMDVQIANLLRNGSFEWGLGEDGVGLRWTRFDNGGAKYIFSAESWPPAIQNGDYAQRITIYEAHQPDRYAGIYQRLKVIPGEPYQLKLHGQVRSWAGDINVSNYGYRMQYAIDWRGGTDWQAIPDDEWIELPWDEQLIDSAGTEMLDYSATVIPPRETLTLFIRAWNKWPDPVEAQYTLDTLSLVGPAPPEALVDGALPLSGGEPESFFLSDPRLWASLLFLLFLAGMTYWRNRARRTTR